MKEFEKALTDLINTHSLEGESDTPDFILAEYLTGCLKAFNHSSKDQATADHAALAEEAFLRACKRRAARNAPPKPERTEEAEQIENCPSKHLWAWSDIRDQKECRECPATWSRKAIAGGYDHEGNYLLEKK